MSAEIRCEELGPDSWNRVRELRLASLRESPEMIGGDLMEESSYSEDQWRELFKRNAYFVATRNEEDLGILAIENLAPGSGDFGATCWIGGTWIDPKARGLRIMRRFFELIDNQATERGWLVQGLGVFVDNHQAIALYERVGFVAMGEVQASTRKPGRFYQRMIRAI